MVNQKKQKNGYRKQHKIIIWIIKHHKNYKEYYTTYNSYDTKYLNQHLLF